MTSDDKIAELERKLTALRIESERLQEAHRLIEGDLLQLKASTDTPRADRSNSITSVNSRIARTSVEGIGSSNEPQILDRNGKPLHVGSRVYICTKGAHRATRGTVTKLAKAPKLVEILDTDGITQNRLSTNLVIEDINTLRYLK